MSLLLNNENQVNIQTTTLQIVSQRLAGHICFVIHAKLPCHRHINGNEVNLNVGTVRIY